MSQTPRVVAVPPTYAVRDLCRTADGEIRHYGWKIIGGRRTAVYIASRDEGVCWSEHIAEEGDVGAMVRSPWSGDWIYFTTEEPGTRTMLVRSRLGPGDTGAEKHDTGWTHMELRQLIALKSRPRWVAAFSDVKCRDGECYHAAVAFSDDDGRTWTRVAIAPVPGVARMHPDDKRPHWFNDGCEPSVAELRDGTLLMALRTSGEHVAFCRSSDGGETWSEAGPDEAFWAANTMPLLFPLADGRLLFVWNNTSMLPTRDAAEVPELANNPTTLSGQWESVFTNRDALHAAISSDDGKTWRGFREIALTETRNATDFRELGMGPDEEHDKSVHQTQALELAGGRVLVAYGQNSAARRIMVFDPDWLLETERHEEFRYGLHNVSHHLYVKSLAGGWRGWAGHCAWNRLPAAVMARLPDTDAATVREAVWLVKVDDPRLVINRPGMVWNFPAARKGRVRIECRIGGEGFRLTLSDHWMNPCEETGLARSPFTRAVTPDDLAPEAWHELTVEWDGDAGTASLAADGHPIAAQNLAWCPRFGLSYLHLQLLADGPDHGGCYFLGFSFEGS